MKIRLFSISNFSVPFLPVIVLFFDLMTTGCSDSESEGSVAEAIESGITAISAPFDEVSGKTQSFSFEKSDSLQSECVSEKVKNQTCNAGVKTKTFECSLPRTSFEGTVTLTFSSAACAFEVGESITRTYETTRTNASGVVFKNFSTDSKNFLGETIGGGSTLSRSESGFSLTILGRHRTRTNSTGEKKVDVSIKTEEPLVSVGLDRNDRQISSGKLSVYHNLLKKKVTQVYKDLGYEEDCCTPTSGSVEILVDDSDYGSITFNACEKATVTLESGKTEEIEFETCE